MFNGVGAESLCAKAGAAAGYATEGGASTNLAPVNTGPPTTARTISAHDVAFPLRNAFSPVTRAGIPVPGLNTWPGQMGALSKRYYGLSGGASISRSAKGKIEKAFAKPSGFGGLGGLGEAQPGPFDPGWENRLPGGNIGLPPVYNPPGQPPIGGGGSNGGINWDNFFGGLFKTLPGTISAITGKADPLNRNPQAVYTQSQQGQYAPEGYAYNSSGQLVKIAANNITDFITENPLLVGGVIIGAVLLFMRPPGRR